MQRRSWRKRSGREVNRAQVVPYEASARRHRIRRRKSIADGRANSSLAVSLSCSADTRRLAFRTGATSGLAGSPAHPCGRNLILLTFRSTTEAPYCSHVSSTTAKLQMSAGCGRRGHRCNTRRGDSMANGLGIALESREQLQRVIVRLLIIADQLTDPAIQYSLMLLADELVTIIEDEIRD